MGFSSALQGQTAHEALLVRQDAELRLLETMKRCLAQKVKCDKEYAIALTTVAQQGLKVDRSDDLQGKEYRGLGLDNPQPSKVTWMSSFLNEQLRRRRTVS